MNQAIRKLTKEPEIEPAALPCPFCGAPATIEYWHGGRPTKRMIACSNRAGLLRSPPGATCEVSPCVTGETRREALAHWNQRA
jgi:hypothetical protein